MTDAGKRCEASGVADDLRTARPKHEKLVRLYPLRRLGQPGDMASMVALLASDQGSWITGEVISGGCGFIMVWDVVRWLSATTATRRRGGRKRGGARKCCGPT
jgi:NAD(P)-dependent dehydrogenase (short-subunit alcohol dehydrogenase family)